jgi:hypothetical protein
MSIFARRANGIALELRRTVESSGGSVRMKVSALMRPFGYMTPSPQAAIRLHQALQDADLALDGRLADLAWDDDVCVSLASAMAAVRARGESEGAATVTAMREPGHQELARQEDFERTPVEHQANAAAFDAGTLATAELRDQQRALEAMVKAERSARAEIEEELSRLTEAHRATAQSLADAWSEITRRGGVLERTERDRNESEAARQSAQTAKLGEEELAAERAAQAEHANGLERVNAETASQWAEKMTESEIGLSRALERTLRELVGAADQLVEARRQHESDTLQRMTELADIERRITDARALLATSRTAGERERGEPRDGALQWPTNDKTVAAAPSTSPSKSEEPGVDMPLEPDVTAAAESRPDPSTNALGLHEQPMVERAPLLLPEPLPPPENPWIPETSSVPEVRNGYQSPAATGPTEAEGGEDDHRRSRLFGFRKRRAFVDYPGKCAVCGIELKVDGARALKESGWVVGDMGGLCPGCQTASWEWPEGAVLPLRRSATQA